jgi:hypothetical protein
MKVLLYLLIVFVPAGGIVLGVLLCKEKTKSEQYLSLYEEYADKNEVFSTIVGYRNFEIDLNGKDLNNNIEVSDGKGNPVGLSHLFDQDKLVLFFSDSHCDECINAEIDRLNELSDYNRIVVLINATNNRYVSQYKNSHQLKYPIYEVETSQEQIRSVLYPFYFVLESKTMRVNSTFVPQKHLPEDTNQYLNKIIRDYF